MQKAPRFTDVIAMGASGPVKPAREQQIAHDHHLTDAVENQRARGAHPALDCACSNYRNAGDNPNGRTH